MIDFIPEVAVITAKNEMDVSKNYIRICVAIRDEFYWCVCFGGTAKYVDKYSKVGSKVFLRKWKFKQPNNIIVDKIDILAGGVSYEDIQ